MSRGACTASTGDCFAQSQYFARSSHELRTKCLPPCIVFLWPISLHLCCVLPDSTGARLSFSPPWAFTELSQSNPVGSLKTEGLFCSYQGLYLCLWGLLKLPCFLWEQFMFLIANSRRYVYRCTDCLVFLSLFVVVAAGGTQLCAQCHTHKKNRSLLITLSLTMHGGADFVLSCKL